MVGGVHDVSAAVATPSRPKRNVRGETGIHGNVFGRGSGFGSSTVARNTHAKKANITSVSSSADAGITVL
jgi:hypothetical protein